MASRTANPQWENAFGKRLLTKRQAAGLTQTQVAKTCNVRLDTYRAWEQGSHAPKLWRVGEIAQALGAPVASLLIEPNPSTCITEVWVSPETLQEIKREGRGRSQEVAQRLARALEPLLYQAALGMTRTPNPTQRRAKPRRTREQVLAGITQATEARARAKQAYADSQAEQPGGGDELTAQ